jgi:Domain of unknown function (DUF222)
MSYLPVSVKFMFDTMQESRPSDGIMFNPDDTGPASVPLERLEAQICELAGHLAAATCRFLVLLGDFDARRGWASWEMTSCAAWLSWKCQMSSGTAREHVRVARALRDLPVIRGEFGAGRLSYAKVRALTRIATAATEADLAELAGPMTGNQLERFARAHRVPRRGAGCCMTAPGSYSIWAGGGAASPRPGRVIEVGWPVFRTTPAGRPPRRPGATGRPG